MKTANKPKRNYARWIILIVAVLLCALYFFVPPVQEFVGHAASVLASSAPRVPGPWAPGCPATPTAAP